jgi:prepilin peptidase dependent protein C
MPDPLNSQRGFSLPEVMLAMVLMIMIVTALSGYQKPVSTTLASRLAAKPAVPVFIACELAG